MEGSRLHHRTRTPVGTAVGTSASHLSATQHHDRSIGDSDLVPRLHRVTMELTAFQNAIRRIENDFPSSAKICIWNREIELFVMRVEEKTETVIRYTITALIEPVDLITVQEHRDGFRETLCPVIL